MLDYLSFFLVAGDVAQGETFDHAVKSEWEEMGRNHILNAELHFQNCGIKSLESGN